MRDLNAPIAPARGELVLASAINAHGQITGFGFNLQGNADGFLLTPVAPIPVPARVPASLPWLAAALAALGILRHRGARG
jgi:hypothetical protein